MLPFIPASKEAILAVQVYQIFVFDTPHLQTCADHGPLNNISASAHIKFYLDCILYFQLIYIKLYLREYSTGTTATNHSWKPPFLAYQLNQTIISIHKRLGKC